jgi:very-short-patch-repair endonuclease
VLERKLIVEIDGAQHAWYAEYDAKRTREIEDHRFVVLRFTNSDVLEDIDAVKLKIVEAARLPPTLTPDPSPVRERGGDSSCPRS